MAHAHFSPVGGSSIDIAIQPQSGDVYYFSRTHFGAGANSSTDEATVLGDGGSSPWTATHGVDGDAASNIITGTILVQSTQEGALRHAFLYSSATSRQTSDYFAVGSTVEVLPSTWDDGATETTITGSSNPSYNSNNLYRKFKVTGHVTNQFNTEFAKLDSFPAAEANSQPVETGSGSNTKIQLDDLPDYNLKITSNNGTVRSYVDTATTVTLNEVQVVVMGTGVDGSTQTATFKLSYKGEMSQDMDATSTKEQIAEEINGFSALSGPVTVGTEGDAKWKVTFDAADGDVAQLVAHASAGTAFVVTRANGWSIEGPITDNLDTMQA